MASPQPYWVEKELRTYNSVYRVWFQLGIADHVTIAEMFTSETSAYQGLLVILEQAVSSLSFRDLLVRLHLMICFFPFSIKTDNSVKKKGKKLYWFFLISHVWLKTHRSLQRGLGTMIERLFESAVMSAVATDEYAYWWLIVEAGVLFSSWFMQDILCSLKWTNS